MVERVVESMACQWLATLFVGAVSFALIVWLARAMGPAMFGQYNYVLTLAALLAIAQDGGFKTLLLREHASATPAFVAHTPDLLALAVGHVIVATGLLLAVAIFLPTTATWALRVAILTYALIALGQMFSAQLKGQGLYVKDALWQGCQRLLSALAIALFLLYSEPTITGVFVAWGAGLLFAWLCFPGASLPKLRLDLKADIYRTVLAFVVIDIATTIYFRIDVVMLSALGVGDQAVGEYSAMYRVLEAFVLLAAPLATIFFRQLRTGWQDVNASRRKVGVALLLIFLVAVLIVTALWFIRRPLVVLVYGEGYSSATDLLFWVMATLVFLLPSYVLTQVAIALNKEAFYAGAACVAAAVNILLNFWLIPLHGALGAAWATLATEAVLFFTLLAGVRKWLARA